MPAHPHSAFHDTVSVEERHVDVEPHAERVHGTGGNQQQRPLDAVTAEQPLPAGGTRVGHFERCQHLPTSHQPRHGLGAYGYGFSPSLSMATNFAMRRARVSGRFASCTWYRIA